MDDQNNPIKKLITFINSCSDERLFSFFKPDENSQDEDRTPDQIEELVTALKSVALNPLLIQDNPPEDAESSTETRTFSFTYQSARRLKDAVGVLCLLTSLEVEEVVMIEVGLQRSACFEITACTPVSEFHPTVGYLHLKACHMSNFQCKQPFERKFVSLFQIYDILEKLPDDVDADITIYHVDGSQELSFELLGIADDVGPHTVEFLPERQEIIRQLPGIVYMCYAVLPAQWLKDRVPLMETSTKLSRPVVLKITEGIIASKIGTDPTHRCLNMKIPGASNKLSRLIFEASFKWTCCDALVSASSLADLFKVFFSIDGVIAFKFKVAELGYLSLRKATETINVIKPR